MKLTPLKIVVGIILISILLILSAIFGMRVLAKQDLNLGSKSQNSSEIVLKSASKSQADAEYAAKTAEQAAVSSRKAADSTAQTAEFAEKAAKDASTAARAATETAFPRPHQQVGKDNK